MLFLEEMEESIKESNLPPSYKEVVTLPASPTLPDRKTKLCRMVKTSASYGFHLNGIQGKQGHHYINEVRTASPSSHSNVVAAGETKPATARS